MSKIYLNGKFKNWVIDEKNGKIFDEGNNEYDIGEIRALFYFRQWKNDFEGHNGRIRSLKEHLDKKIKETKMPEVLINWGDVQEKYIHPHYRK